MDVSPQQSNAAPPAPLARDWRDRVRRPLLLAGPLLAIAAACYYYFGAGASQSTDDAYVMAARVQVSANIAGRVSEVAVTDNQPVRRGELLFRLDDVPLKIAVQEAVAQLATAGLQVRTLKANFLKPQAELIAVRQTLAFRQRELDRLRRLQNSGIASQVQVDRAANALDEARGMVVTKQQECAAVASQLGGNPYVAPEKHPMVMQAQANLDRARLNLSYVEVRAPMDGVVTRVEQLQVGSYVAAMTPVFALVSTDDVWIEANFKENQLGSMRPGQDAVVRIDSIRGRKFRARVASVSPGTGSQFSLLPPENASGNWVKVVQRVPVRIELIDSHHPPLHAGLSAAVDVDTSVRAGLPVVAEQLNSRLPTRGR